MSDQIPPLSEGIDRGTLARWILEHGEWVQRVAHDRRCVYCVGIIPSGSSATIVCELGWLCWPCSIDSVKDHKEACYDDGDGGG